MASPPRHLTAPTSRSPACHHRPAPHDPHASGEQDPDERGVVLPGRYADDAIPGSLRNQAAIVEHARRLAGRIDLVRSGGLAPLVLGGDCGILVAAGLSLRRAPGRYGRVHLDGHTGFRHPGNSGRCASLAGEDLAAAVGRHWPAIAGIDGPGPYFSPANTAHAGCRDDDEDFGEATAVLGAVLPASQIRHGGVEGAARTIRGAADPAGLDGYWVHLDVDILDPGVMPAVDSPGPGGRL